MEIYAVAVGMILEGGDTTLRADCLFDNSIHVISVCPCDHQRLLPLQMRAARICPALRIRRISASVLI
jgi:hypothetical protein